MKLAILALDGVFDTGLAALLDIFSTANELAAMQGMAGPAFQVDLVGIRPQVRTALGLTASVGPAEAVGQPDWIVVPALNTKQPARLVAALASADVVAAGELLRGWQDRGIGVAGACIGTFLLAEAGLLDGRAATTTWSLAPLFRQRYPAVRLDDQRMIVASGRVVTAAAMMGHLDLALWLVRQASPEMAALVARFMLVDKRPSRGPISFPITWPMPTRWSNVSSAGPATTWPPVSRCRMRPGHCRSRPARCSAGPRRCWASRRWPLSRTSGSSVPSI